MMHRLGAGADVIVTARNMRIPYHVEALLQMLEYWEGNGECYYVSFDHVAEDMNLPRQRVRKILRHFVRKGLVERTQLFTDDGMIAGSGHGITSRGRVVAKLLEERKAKACKSP